MRITSVEKLTDERWLNLVAATYENRGRTGRWLFASRRQRPGEGGPDAVLMVPILRNPGEPPRLEPERVELEAQSVRTSVVLTNRSAVPAEVALAATDKAQALSFEFLGGPRVSIPAGQTLRVPLQISSARVVSHDTVWAVENWVKTVAASTGDSGFTMLMICSPPPLPSVTT